MDLLHEVGQALGQESNALGVDLLLGPGINIKRSLLAVEILNIFRKIHCSLENWVRPISMVCRARAWVPPSNTMLPIMLKQDACGPIQLLMNARLMKSI